ncbi:MAG: SDR family NAD(P)-dependent oxidoreductase [Aestuariivita sp.]|nr:SDR family NAD(P)-dependent oxidoreductase [Aestuariivita sp.]
MNSKIALVTGASRGLGWALAQELCVAYNIIAVARTIGALEELSDRIRAKKGHAILAPMDITKKKSTKVLCRSIFDRWGRLDLWVHTAIHAAPLTPANHIASNDWKISLATNVTAVSTLITHIAPLLGNNGQAIFFEDENVIAKKFFGTYGATKAAQIALVKSWKHETSNTGPNVYIFKPNPMPTGCRARFFPGEDKSRLSPPGAEALRLTEAFSLSTGRE